MANRLETAISQHRAALRAIDRAAMAEVFSSYQDVMERLEPLIELLQQEAERYGVLTAAQLFRLDRYQELQRLTAVEMERLAQLTGDVTAQAQARAIRESVEASRVIAIASARGTAATAQISIGWTSLPTSAVEDLIGATRSGPLADLIGTFGDDMGRVLTEELVSGLALGQGPRVVADAIHKATDIGRNRALTISRTEMLQASRRATLSNYANNDDILDGWIWTAAHSERTCLSCLALDGQEFPLSVQFFPTHPNCRCGARPKLRNIPMRPVQTGREWFAAQPEAVQQQMIPKSVWEDFAAGRLSLEDFVQPTESADWGDGYREATIGEAWLNAAGRGRLAA